MRIVSSVSALALVVVLAGCTVSPTPTEEMPPDELSAQVSTMLEEQVGYAPESVDCPDPLPVEEGRSVRCTLTDAGLTYGVTATVASATDGDVRLEVDVDDEPVEEQP